MKKRRQRSAPVNKPLVDVVIPTAGRFDMLEKCLNSLKTTQIPVNVIAIDNGSSVEERKAFPNIFDNVQVKHLPQPIGFPRASNEGARMGRAPLILFLNDDCVLEPGALELMVAKMDESEIGVVGAKLLFPEDSESPIRPAGKVQHVGLACNVAAEIVHPLVGWSADNPKTCVSREVLAVTGACLMIRRSIFNRVGGFDPIYGMGTFEDVDICFAARKEGYKVWMEAKAVGHHYTGATVERLRQGYPLASNYIIFRSKWINTPFLLLDDFSYW